MKDKRMTIEAGFYMTAFAIGLLIRLYRLGSLPLGDTEASLALQALSAANGNLPALGSLTSYFGITKLLFYILEATPFLARLWPALVGSLLILVPWLFRELLGKLPAIILSFGFALDSLLIASSRQVNGEILAITFLLAAIGFFYNHAYAWSGISLALAFMSGPAFLQGLVIILLVYLADKFLVAGDPLQVTPSVDRSGPEEPQKRHLIYWALGTFLFFGTLFFTNPQTTGSTFLSLPEYLKGWTVATGVNAGLLLISLVSYEVFPFVFGLIQIVRHSRNSDRFQKILIFGTFFALLLWIVYPGRQILGLVWIVVPLWALASRGLFSLLSAKEADTRIISALLAVLILVLLIFAAISLSSLTNETPTNITSGLSIEQVKWIRVVGALVVSGLLVTLVAWGWSIKSAMKGLYAGLAVFMFVLMLSSSWNAAGLGRHPEAELYRVDGNILEADLFLKTIEDHLEWNVNSQPELEVVVVDVPLPSVQWMLRGQSNVWYSSFLPVDSNPGIVVTRDQETLAQTSSYSGQNFIWRQRTNWSLILPREWLRWLFFREAPNENEVLVVWVRSDLFPGTVQ